MDFKKLLGIKLTPEQEEELKTLPKDWKILQKMIMFLYQSQKENNDKIDYIYNKLKNQEVENEHK